MSKSSALISANIGGFFAEVLVNFVLPYVIYDRLSPTCGDVYALLASSLPPIFWSILEFWRKRRVDALSLLIIAGIALSLLGFAGGGGPKYLQMRENLVSAVIGLAFLGSAAIGKPLAYPLALAVMKRKSGEEAEKLEARKNDPGVRRAMTLITLVWGFGLVCLTGLMCWLVFTLSIREYLVVSPFVGYGINGALGLWTYLYVQYRKKKRLPGQDQAFQNSP
jgi:hypothetical protein